MISIEETSITALFEEKNSPWAIKNFLKNFGTRKPLIMGSIYWFGSTSKGFIAWWERWLLTMKMPMILRRKYL